MATSPLNFSLFPQQQQQLIPGLSNGLLGLGLLTGASTIGRDEPGYVGESRQILRNLQSPQSYGQVFGQTVQGLQDPFLPLLKQQAETGIQDIAQRGKMLFPSNAPLQGQVLGDMERYLREQLVPTQQAFLGQLGQQGINTQFQAANSIIEGAKPDPFRSALAALGGTLMSGQGGGFSLGQGSGLDSLLGSLLGGGNNNGGGLGGAIGNFLGGSNSNLANQLTQFGLSLGNQVGTGRELLDVTGYPVGVLGAGGQLTDMFGNPLAGAAGLGGGQTGGLTSFLGGTGGTLSGILGLAGAGLGGYFSGNMIGQQIPGSQVGATGAGAAGGAAAGAIAGSVLPGIGTAVGAIIGAIAGGGGGFFGSRAASQAEKAANLRADQESQGSQGRAIADFFLSRINALGGDTSGLMPQVATLINNINAPGDQQSEIAALLGPAFLREAKRLDPSITSLESIPGIRDQFLDFLSTNAWIAPSAGQRSPFNQSGPGGTGDAVRGNARAAGFSI